MQKTRITLLLPLLLLSLYYAWTTYATSREPSYGGRPLREWVTINVAYAYPGVQQGQADTALRAMGTDALPFLLRWLRYDQPAWKKQFVPVAATVMGWFGSTYYDESLARAEFARLALPQIGSSAQAAIPELVQMVNRPNASLQARSRAYCCLENLSGLSMDPKTRRAAAKALSRVDHPRSTGTTQPRRPKHPPAHPRR